MITDFEDFVTWMYVVIDDLWQPLARLAPRPGPAPETCSDSELITLAIVGACRGWHTEPQLLSEWAAYRHLFPRLPDRSRFNRRRRNLMGAINQIRAIVLRTLDVAQERYAAIDSLPVPVVAFHLAPQRSRAWDASGATFGRCSSKHQVFFGYRLHVVLTLGGVILDFALTGATGDEREVAADLLSDQPGRIVLGDKGYVSAPLAEGLAAQGVQLLAVRRRNQHARWPPALTRLVTHFRQIIETVNGQLVDQLGVQRTHAHTFWGLCARVYTALTAHTLCLALNRWLGNPNWLQIKALAFPN